MSHACIWTRTWPFLAPSLLARPSRIYSVTQIERTKYTCSMLLVVESAAYQMSSKRLRGSILNSSSEVRSKTGPWEFCLWRGMRGFARPWPHSPRLEPPKSADADTQGSRFYPADVGGTYRGKERKEMCGTLLVEALGCDRTHKW
ncbi:hypothetical protein BDW72DRAFT_145371 [Aspergillus terricola var. indicus]